MIRDDGMGLDKSRARQATGQNLQFGFETTRQLSAQVKDEFSITNFAHREVAFDARLPIQGECDAYSRCQVCSWM